MSYGLGQGTILAMDIEGTEFAVLEAMLAQPDTLPAALFVEFHPWHVADPLSCFRSKLLIWTYRSKLLTAQSLDKWSF